MTGQPVGTIDATARIHALADVAACVVGPGTRIWQFVVILNLEPAPHRSNTAQQFNQTHPR